MAYCKLQSHVNCYNMTGVYSKHCPPIDRDLEIICWFYWLWWNLKFCSEKPQMVHMSPNCANLEIPPHHVPTKAFNFRLLLFISLKFGTVNVQVLCFGLIIFFSSFMHYSIGDINNNVFWGQTWNLSFMLCSFFIYSDPVTYIVILHLCWNLTSVTFI